MSSGIWYLICSPSPSFQTSRGTSLAQYLRLVRNRNTSLRTLDQLCGTRTRSPRPPVGRCKTKTTPVRRSPGSVVCLAMGKTHSCCTPYVVARRALFPTKQSPVRKQSPVFNAVHQFYNFPPILLLTADKQFPCHFPPPFATYVVASNGDRAASRDTLRAEFDWLHLYSPL